MQARFETDTARAHLALRIDDPLPGELQTLRCVPERLADLPRVARQARERRHLAIGRHPAGRDLPDDGIDLLGWTELWLRHGLREFIEGMEAVDGVYGTLS